MEVDAGFFFFGSTNGDVVKLWDSSQKMLNIINIRADEDCLLKSYKAYKTTQHHHCREILWKTVKLFSFLVLQPAAYPLSSHPSLFPKNNKDKTLNIKSYQSILQITLTAPSVNLTSFYRDIHEKATEKFKIPSHSKIAPVVPIRAAYLYDAVIIYGNWIRRRKFEFWLRYILTDSISLSLTPARAATKVLNEHGDLRDGQNLMQKYVFNNKFTSKQGFQVREIESETLWMKFALIFHSL